MTVVAAVGIECVVGICLVCVGSFIYAAGIRAGREHERALQDIERLAALAREGPPLSSGRATA